jgi:predicted RNA-binding protein associated with RNAse of E/G family
LLDIVCERSREWRWKDEDELADAVAFGLIAQEYADEIRAEGERVVRMFESWDPPFSDAWEDWRPDASWPIPALPEDWAA